MHHPVRAVMETAPIVWRCPSGVMTRCNASDVHCSVFEVPSEVSDDDLIISLDLCCVGCGMRVSVGCPEHSWLWQFEVKSCCRTLQCLSCGCGTSCLMEEGRKVYVRHGRGTSWWWLTACLKDVVKTAERVIGVSLPSILCFSDVRLSNHTVMKMARTKVVRTGSVGMAFFSLCRKCGCCPFSEQS